MFSFIDHWSSPAFTANAGLYVSCHQLISGRQKRMAASMPILELP
jgi:hypothetical protein